MILENDIIICGSFKFKNEMRNLYEVLTVMGYIVKLPIEIYNGYDIMLNQLYKNNKRMDEQYKSKLTENVISVWEEAIRKTYYKSVIVFNKDNYIGFQTAKELELAIQCNKDIYYLERISNNEEKVIIHPRLNIIGDHPFYGFNLYKRREEEY